jgi:hypothetical protein
MSRLENVLTETLRDPERALPSWVDPVGRVRRARAAQRRRRLTAAGGALALVAVTAIAVPMLREDEKRGRGPTGITEQQPVAVPSGSWLLPGNPVGVAAVTAIGGVDVAVLATARFEGRSTYYIVNGTTLTASGPKEAAPGTATGLLHAAGTTWILGPGSVRRADATACCLPADQVYAGGCFAPTAACSYARWHRGAVAGDFMALTGTDGISGTVMRLYLVDAVRGVSVNLPNAVVLPGTAGDRVTAADGAIWVRRSGLDDGDGSWLIRYDDTTLEETGRVKLPGSLKDGAIVAGGGSVWATTAVTNDILTTSGGVIPVDAQTLEVGEPIESPLALQMAYSEGNVWLRGASLTRIDAASRTLRGTPVTVDGPASGPISADGHYVWVATKQGLLRYDWRYDEPRP